MAQRSKKSTIETTTDFAASLSEQLRLTARRPNIYGYIPHSKQEKFHAAPSRGKLYIGGNRAGKTVAGVCEDIWWLTGRHPYRQTPPPPIRGRIVGVDFLNGIEKILRPELARWMPLSELKGGSWETAYSKELRTLTLENGSFVEFMSYDQDLDKFAGVSRHFTHFDEEPPQDIFTECKARLIDTGGDWWMTMTPVEGMSWIYDDIYMPGRNDPDSDISVIEVDMTENPHIKPEEIQSFVSGLSGDEKAARLHGKFVQRGGLVYKAFDPQIHVIDAFVPPHDWEWYLSVDHGYNNPTAILWHAVSPDGVAITFSEHYMSEKIVSYHAQVVHQRNAGFGRLPDHLVCDPALAQRQGVTGTSIQQEYADNGVYLNPGNNDVLSGVNKINSYLQLNSEGKPRWYITRNCTNLIYEIQRLRWKTWATKKGQNENNKHDSIHKKDDHACDSSRYFFTLLPDLRPLPLESEKEVARIIGYDIGSGGTPPVAGRYDELLKKSLDASKLSYEDDPWTYEYETVVPY